MFINLVKASAPPVTTASSVISVKPVVKSLISLNLQYLPSLPLPGKLM